MAGYGLDLQLEVYGKGEVPDHPFSYEGWEQRAREVLDAGAFGYIAGGAGAEWTMRANREAFYRWRLRPRMLRDVSERDLSVEVLGARSAGPFMLAPVGVLSIAHPEAELAVARAAAATGVPVILSTVSSFTLEEVARESGDAPRWFQLYPGRSPELNRSLVERAERAGYSAVVITLDTTMLGFRRRDLENAYLPFLKGEGVANYFSDPVFRARLKEAPERDPEAAVRAFLAVYVTPDLTWDDVNAVREATSLPVLVKGITHPEDAREAVRQGVEGLVVSNHGGRQVDGAVAALDALPEVVEAVGGSMPVLFDSGVRSGADALKAVALGATATLVGRPYAYALAAAGESGVRCVIRSLLAEVDLQLALSGYRSVRELGASSLLDARD